VQAGDDGGGVVERQQHAGATHRGRHARARLGLPQGGGSVSAAPGMVVTTLWVIIVYHHECHCP
jgi:hypothetical protein